MNKQIQTQLTTLAASSTSTNGPEQQPVNPSAAVASFIAARDGLQQRQSELEAELAEIQRMLNGDDNGPVPVKTATPTPPPATPTVPATSSERRRSNGGLRKAVADLLASGPLTKDQIIEKLLAQKFEFFGKPRPALDPILYSKKFQRTGKLFRLVVAP